ncbi:hypothetical protein [Arthrobacter zhaoguopingii]|uniref:hypothetical protein n=1 Tax=Arthrobacter zhaoguopingii TaxID=2681491 RepID=UPI001FE8E9BF|nr:hypothetical protein [Arthrobacter zhaoguopingii]
MYQQPRTVHRARAALLASLALSTLSITACGTQEPGAAPQGQKSQPTLGTAPAPGGAPPYDGAYDQTFSDNFARYDGERVTVSAEVNEIISPAAFTIAGTEDTLADELLIVHAAEESDLLEGLTVSVTGTVHTSFDVQDAETDLGVDLNEALYRGWNGQPYIEASAVDTSVIAD